MSTSELACTYAALILHDDGLDITVRQMVARATRRPPGAARQAQQPSLGALAQPAAPAPGARPRSPPQVLLQPLTFSLPPPQADAINTIVKAAGIEVEPYWPALFAKLFAKKSMDDLITNVGAGACPAARATTRAGPQRPARARARAACSRASGRRCACGPTPVRNTLADGAGMHCRRGSSTRAPFSPHYKPMPLLRWWCRACRGRGCPRRGR
jgi:ribosomal protein L12E/L44/L45/RPP1/RPP2